jgi:hypothetical protein
MYLFNVIVCFNILEFMFAGTYSKVYEYLYRVSDFSVRGKHILVWLRHSNLKQGDFIFDFAIRKVKVN